MADTNNLAPTNGPEPYRIEVVGQERAIARDLYHALLRLSWPRTIGLLIGLFTLINVCFAVAFHFAGGVANMREGSILDSFAFSVQTLATIGYGSMYPVSPLAHLLVFATSVTSMLVTALSTGIVFAKFSLSAARIGFTREAVISAMDGIPTLSFRIGNQRANTVAEATVRVVLIRTEKTLEGKTFYRMYDLPLVRERSPALTRSWQVMHRIGPESLLHGYDTARLASEEVELLVTVSGTDDTSLQPVHARHTYYAHQILFGRRHVDVLSERPDGTMVLDLRRFHEHEAG